MSSSGDIGEIRYICARRLNLGLFQKDINVAWDLAPHDISIILHIMEKEAVAINCQGSAHITPGVEDVTTMWLNFPGDRSAIIHSSWLDPRKIREMTIVGSKQMIVYDDVSQLEKIRIFDARVERPPHYDTFAEFHYAYHYGDVHVPYIKQEEPLKTECQHFLDCINQGTTPLTDGRQGLELVRILEASSQSLKRGGAPVNLSGQENWQRLDAVDPRIRHTHFNLGNRKEENFPSNRQKAAVEASGSHATSLFKFNPMSSSQQSFQRIAPDVKLGKNVRLYGFVNLYGCEIGDDVKIGTFVEIQKGVKIGNRCKISSHTFICEGVTLEDEVFIGHNVTFTNDRYPRATNDGGQLQTDADWICIPTLVKRGASIGSGATLLCGITIGENAMIGAGSVVTKDVPAGAVVAGNPARLLHSTSAKA